MQIEVSLVGLLPNVPISIEIEPDEVWVSVSILYSSDKLAANSDDDIFLCSFVYFNMEITDACLGYGHFAD